jgi:hypothetical protein
MLSYGNRSKFVDGIEDIFAKPVLTLSEEFDRDITWTDWKGVTYSLRDEYEYVTGAAKLTYGCTPGVRDAQNDGKRPEDFLHEMNDLILRRRKEGYGLNMPEDLAFLSMEEILSVRLYSGPSFAPINEFLRQISELTGRFRRLTLDHPGLTFSCTVGHICHAIRKIAAISTPDEASTPLFRGVRGELPQHFWLPDKKGMICAVDMAFMSTSTNQHTPISYLGKGKNVLWCLHPSPETDVAYHRGADISLLSQFGSEDEVLFPPCTMLVVQNSEVETVVKDDVARCRSSSHFQVDETKSFVSIHVIPYFL